MSSAGTAQASRTRRRPSVLKPVTCIGLFLLLFIFIIIPILVMLFRLKSDDVTFIFKDRNFYVATGNTALYSFISAFIATILATITAYFLNRARIRHKEVFVLLLTLPMLIPTISVGLGIRLLFGVGGYLDRIFGFNYDATGTFTGLILASVTVAFPVSFLLVYDSLQYENKIVYDACETLGIKPASAFFRITLPYLAMPLVSTFFAAFTLTFSDYGVPMEIAGKIRTLPMYLYEALFGSQYGRGAVIGVIMIIPAAVAFLIDIFTKEKAEEEAQEQLIKASKAFNVLVAIGLSVFSFLILLPQLAFVITAFVKRYPNDLSFTFAHFDETFNATRVLSAWNGLANSLFMACLTAAIGTCLAYVTAYMSARSGSKAARPLHLVSTSSLAIPGLVIGIGYIAMFSGTTGWFYNTMAILIVVNAFHFFTPPYLMAKNAFAKLNRNYEIVGDTLGISNPSIFFKVIIPNTLSTIVQMFSYYFIHAMNTISAIAFLSTYSDKPLALFINDYTNRDQNYENAAVVSLVLFISNIAFTFISDATIYVIGHRKKKYKEGEIMKLSRYQFEALTYIEHNGPAVFTQRQLADALTVSMGNVSKITRQLLDFDFIAIEEDGKTVITEKGLAALEPYRVRKAIIIAAGLGHRLAPVSFKIPKPMVKVNGKRLIDNMIDALLAAGIDDITVVRGYKKEQFDALLDKYPDIKFIDNPIYNESNNISSVYAARHIIDRCYICNADLILREPGILTKYQFATCYYGAPVKETDDWCLWKKGDYVSRMAIGGENCYHMVGISYWSEKDSITLRRDIEKVFNSRGGKENNWSNVPLKICKRDFKIEIREFSKPQINEIDNYSELVVFDPSYLNFEIKL